MDCGFWSTTLYDLHLNRSDDCGRTVRRVLMGSSRETSLHKHSTFHPGITYWNDGGYVTPYQPVTRSNCKPLTHILILVGKTHDSGLCYVVQSVFTPSSRRTVVSDKSAQVPDSVVTVVRLRFTDAKVALPLSSVDSRRTDTRRPEGLFSTNKSLFLCPLTPPCVGR